MCFLSSCYYDVASEIDPPDSFCDTIAVSYQEVVLPIVVDQCYVCHSIAERRGGVILEPYDALKPWADNGLLSCTINHASDCSAMPENAPKMLECDILKIDKWVNDGALNN